MRVVIAREAGDEDVLEIAERATPAPGPSEVRVAIYATALNRADLMQRQGLYPPPPGAPDILGLECAGEIEALGEGVEGWAVGDRCMALLAGGGYAESTTVHAGSLMPIPDSLAYHEAAAIPEVFLTAFLNLFELGGLAAGGSVLVHGGGSGVGTAAIQLAKAAGATIYVTAGTPDKCARCVELGADHAICYRDEAFREVVRERSGDRGVDLILDPIGGAYLDDNLKSLARGGRLVSIGLMGGAEAKLNLGLLLRNHLQITGSTLRSRSVDEKAQIVRNFQTRFGADIAAGSLRPIVDCVLPLEEAAEAHRRMKASDHFGKIVLETRASPGS